MIIQIIASKSKIIFHFLFIYTICIEQVTIVSSSANEVIFYPMKMNTCMIYVRDYSLALLWSQ